MQIPRTIGMIINPKAGKGFIETAKVARWVVEKFPAAAILTGPDETGAAAFAGDRPVETCPCPADPGRQQTVSLARAMAARPVELLLVLGGDGTLADVALALAETPAAPPVLGIGVGSTNVGPLITCRGSEADQLDLNDLDVTAYPAALVRDRGALLGIGFNDCVLGFTVLGTLDGQVRDLDARAKMEGRNILGEPRPIGTPLTLVERVSTAGTVEVARGDWVSTLVIGFSDPAYFGKAVAGGVCLTSYLGIPAGCLVSDTPMVRIEVTRREVLDMPPQRSHFIGFDETMCIRVSGMRSGTAVCADGNPLKILAPEDQVEFWVRPAAVRALKIRRHS